MDSVLKDISHHYYVSKKIFNIKDDNIKVIVTTDKISYTKLSNDSNKKTVREKKVGTIQQYIKDDISWFKTDNDFKINDSSFIVTTDIRTEIEKFILNVNKSEKYINVLITISGHGYNSSSAQYVSGGGATVYDYTFFDLVSKLNEDTTCLILVDTCHSGTMFNLPYWINLSTNEFKKENDNKTSALIYEISACTDYQLDNDSISDSYGSSGGLTCLYMDFIKDNSVIDLAKLFTYIKQRDMDITIQDCLLSCSDRKGLDITSNNFFVFKPSE
jgi:hypothetical protein